MVHRHAPTSTAITALMRLAQPFQTIPIPCGEGACSRSAAQQSQTQHTALPGRSRLQGWGCFAAQREQAPSPQKRLAPSWISEISVRSCSFSGVNRELSSNEDHYKRRKECIHIPIPICYAMDAVRNRVGPISSPRLCINAAEYSRTGGWGAC